ncbi:hypothetical protein EV178_004103 [Coemansia sp. RSA 1646]|nr:hypothetical protein EV178_004103 [Coemansia sp. RSA 1646]
MPATADILLGNNWLKEHKSVIHCEEDALITEKDKRWKISGIVVQSASVAESAVKLITVNVVTKLMKDDNVDSMGWVCVRFPEDGLKSRLSVAALATLCSKYKQVLEQPPVDRSAPGGPEMEIHPIKRSEPVARIPYCLPHAEMAEVEKWIGKLLKKDYIRTSTSP